MKSEPLVDAAGLVADGTELDLLSLTSSLSSDDERAIADELAVIARIAEAHRKFHHVVPPPPVPLPVDPIPFASSWGHLELIEVVGRGSYGTVYRAWDPRLDRLVALKLFHGARHPETVMREGRMLARIRHENVVTVHGADVHDGIAGIWMEFVHGRRLDQIVEQKGSLGAEEATLVGLAVCRALMAVHGAGLLHCDVKAQNVIREPGGRIVLMDLGAGRSTTPEEDSTEGAPVAGTPRYMAPEVFDNGPALPQSDVYSVGVLLFYMVTGRFPVDGKTLSEIRRAHFDGRHLPLHEARPDLPPAFSREVTRAIDPTPAMRHRTPGELEAGLMGASNATGALVGRHLKRLSYKWIAAAVAVAVALGAAWRFLPVTVVKDTRTIAVLPIRNLTGDQSKAYLADGITETLISNLARVRALRVPSFAAVAGFRDSKESSAAVAKKLGADLLLAGSFLEVGGRARIMVNLIDPETDAVVWAEERTPESPMLLAAQGEIARLLAAHLAVTLSTAEERALRQAAHNPKAQDAYLRARATAETTVDLKSAEAAVANLKLATEIEPSFAEAWAHQALAELRVIELVAGVDRAQRAANVTKMAERAISLDPASVAGYLALGTTQFSHDWNFESAERTLRTGLAIAPSHTLTMQGLAALLAVRGRLDDAIRLGREAVDLEPLQATRHTALGIFYYYNRDFANAEAEMKRALEITPDLPAGHFGLGRVYWATGRINDAIAEIEKSTAGGVRRSAMVMELARLLIAAGQRERADRLIKEVEQRRANGEGFSLDNYAYIAMERGQIDEAFAILEQAVDQRLANVLWIGVDPKVDRIRSDPRFARLLARMGLQQ